MMMIVTRQRSGMAVKEVMAYILRTLYLSGRYSECRVLSGCTCGTWYCTPRTLLLILSLLASMIPTMHQPISLVSFFVYS